jgi:hypothetical protein
MLPLPHKPEPMALQEGLPFLNGPNHQQSSLKEEAAI